MGLNLLSDIWPRTFNILCHLGNCGPVVEDNAESAAHDGFVIDCIGEAKTRAEIGANIVGYLASGIHDYVVGQSTVAGDTRSMTANATWRGQLLHNICSVGEIHIACFNARPARRSWLRFRTGE